MLRKSKSSGAAYSVRAACQHLGIGPHTLRAWEMRYSAVRPERSETGRRTYTPAEIERLEKLVRLVNLGHAIGSVARLPNRALQLLLKRSVSEDLVPTEDLPPPTLLAELKPALEQFDVHLVSSLLDQRRTALGTRLFVLQVLVPLLRWIGVAVDGGGLSIAHEHALSAVLKDQIYQALRYGTRPAYSAAAPRFVLATPEDDLHEFGVLMASALTAHYDLSSHFLGANLPAEALSIAVKAVKGTIVILGNSPVPSDERSISFDAYLSRLHHLLPETVEVWIGGAGKIPHLRRVMSGRTCRVLSSLQELDSLLVRVKG